MRIFLALSIAFGTIFTTAVPGLADDKAELFVQAEGIAEPASSSLRFVDFECSATSLFAAAIELRCGLYEGSSEVSGALVSTGAGSVALAAGRGVADFANPVMVCAEVLAWLIDGSLLDVTQCTSVNPDLIPVADRSAFNGDLAGRWAA